MRSASRRGLLRWDDGIPSTDYIELSDVVRQRHIQLVAFDLRDTLVRPPREQKVARALCRVGVSESLAMRADAAATLALKNELVGLPGVVDWKLVEFYGGVLALARDGLVLAPPDFELAFRFICDDYRDNTVALVPDDMLTTTCRLLAMESCRTAVVTDGPSSREAELLAIAFPSSAQHLALFTSSLINVNKFHPEYYKKLASKFGVQPDRILVIGNRLDKDVNPARAVGCETCLVGSPPPRGYSGYSAPDIIAVLSGPLAG